MHPPSGRSRRRGLLTWAGIIAGAEILAGALYGWIQYLRAPTLRLGAGYPDFLGTYSLARLEASAGLHHLYDQARLLEIQKELTGGAVQRAQPLTSPPYLEILFRPLAALDFHSAYAVWAVITAVLLAAAILVLVRAAGLRGAQAWALGLLGAAWAPVLVAVLQGQVAGIVLLGAAGSAYWWLRRRDVGSGLAAVATLARPHLVLLLPILFLVRRRWRALAALAAGVLVVGVATTTLTGLSVWADYARVLLPGALHGTQGFANNEQAAFGLRGIVDAAGGGSALDTVLPLLLLLGVTVALAVTGERTELDFALAAVASFDAGLHSNLHDLTLLLVGLVLLCGLLARRELRHPRLGWLAVALTYLLVDASLYRPLVGAAGVQVLLAYLLLEKFRKGAVAAC